MAQPLIFINGTASDCLTTLDRGFSYGHGVFETMRLFNGQLPLWQLHLERLQVGLQRLGISLAVKPLSAELTSLLAEMPPQGIVKLTVTAGVGPRGYRAVATATPTVIVHWYPPPQITASVRLCQCRYRLPVNPVLAGIKHLNRLDQVLASMELEGDEQGLLLDVDDNLIEAISHNIFIRIGDRWLTPALDRCGVAGVMRRFLMETLFPAAGLEVEETCIPLRLVPEAGEIFICNAVSGLLPVAEIRGLLTWKPDAGIQPQSALLQTTLEEILPCFAV